MLANLSAFCLNTLFLVVLCFLNEGQRFDELTFSVWAGNFDVGVPFPFSWEIVQPCAMVAQRWTCLRN